MGGSCVLYIATTTSLFQDLERFEVWLVVVIQGNRFQIKHPCAVVLFKCLPVTNGSRRGRAVGWDIVILGWMMAPGQEG